MPTDEFFEEQRDQSRVKAILVKKYFWAWANVIIGSMKRQNNDIKRQRIAYIDLFSGPGRYKDGAASTPLLILEEAIKDPNIAPRLVTIFNDKDENNSSTLQKEINNLSGIGKLQYAPIIFNDEVGNKIVDMFEKMKLVPTLFFVDPWGYKGLSLRLINSVLRNWGCDCIFFFNYNRISMGVNNPYVREHMAALFESRTDPLIKKIDGVSPAMRENIILEELCEALIDIGGGEERFVLPFRFKNDTGTRTSHHLVFVSKNFKGYDIMKLIMAKESSTENQGVASFEYNQADENCPYLFQFTRPLEDLKEKLLKDLAGKRLTTAEIYRSHSIKTPYIMPNYKKVLQELDDESKISIQTLNGIKRRPGTFADNILVSFPV